MMIVNMYVDVHTYGSTQLRILSAILEKKNKTEINGIKNIHYLFII